MKCARPAVVTVVEADRALQITVFRPAAPTRAPFGYRGYTPDEAPVGVVTRTALGADGFYQD